MAGSPRHMRDNAMIVIDVCKNAVPEDAGQPRAISPVPVEVHRPMHAPVPIREVVLALASRHEKAEIEIGEQISQLFVPFCVA